MTSPLTEQARLLHEALVYLVKLYQFRDRNAICAYDISVSQCYALQSLSNHETLSVNALASDLGLTVSTTSRVIDQLVAKELAERRTSETDRRVLEVNITDEGRRLVDRILSGLLTREQEILERIPEEARDYVIWAIQQVSAAASEWRQTAPQT